MVAPFKDGFPNHSVKHKGNYMMLISTHQKDNRKAEIHKDEVDFYVKLIENGVLIETRKLNNKSIHYAESCAENYVERVGSFHI